MWEGGAVVNEVTGCGCWMCTGPIFDDDPAPAGPQPAVVRQMLRLVVDNTW